MTFHQANVPARVTFSEELRGRWPTREVIAEARVDGEPWSIRLRLWSAPDETGTCMAWAETLRPDAPVRSRERIELTLGRTVVGTCVLAELKPTVEGAPRELDFLDAANERGVRAAT